MHIQLPVFYQIEARIKRQHSSSTVYLHEYATFHVDEISGQDAHIAIQGFDRNNILRKNNHFNKIKIQAAAKEPNPTGILRYYEDSFWYPEYDQNNTPMKAEDWTPFYDKNDIEKDDKLSEKRFFDNLFLHTGRSNPITHKVFDADLYRDIESNNFNETYDTYVEKIKQDVLVIDGVVYSRCPEPIFVVANYGDDEHTSIITVFDTDEKIPEAEKIDFFRIDRHDDIVRLYENPSNKVSCDEESRHYPQEVILNSKPEVLLPGVFKFKDEEYTLLEDAKNVLETYGGKLMHYPNDIISQWMDLRDEIKVDDNYSNIENIGRALEILNTSIVEFLKEDDSYNFYFVEPLAKSTKYTIERWNTRPIDLDFDLDQFTM